MTQKGRKEMETDEYIKMIKTTCNGCLLHDDCDISHAVEKNLEHSGKGYGVEEAVISFWEDCCPHMNRRD